MTRPRWRKVFHDLIGSFSRTALVVLSIAVGVFSIGVIVGAYVIISHDMSVISQISTRVAVMYVGRLMELAPRRVFDEARLHPYTEALLAAVPLPDPERPFRPPALKGEPPSPVQVPSGCPFHPRCPEAQMPICRDVAPEYRETAAEHWVACHFR